MSYKEKKQFIALMRKRYAGMTTKKARSRVLDEFCEMTDLSRKHAIRTLHISKTGSKKRGRPSGETKEGTKLLIVLWKLSDMLCCKLLKNLYTPTMRLISKRRDGLRYIKKYEKHPMKPAQRLLASRDVSEENKDKIKQMLKENNVCELRNRMNGKLRKLAVALAKRSEDQSSSSKSYAAKKFTKKDRMEKSNRNKAKSVETKGIPTTK